MKIHFSSLRGKTKSNFSSRISRDRDASRTGFRLFYAYQFVMNMVPKVQWDLKNMWKKFWKFLQEYDDLLRNFVNLLLKSASCFLF